jgi:Ni,Fe-hydrogenase I large subunit
MSHKINVTIPLNRVEGDLEIRAEIDDGVVTDAWSAGTMYRGFERILVGRGALDGLVFTPRICGICGTSHLTAAAQALERITAVSPPPDAVRVRNLALMTEHIQSDMRQGFLMFTADFVNPIYRGQELYEEVVRRYEPFRGETVIEVLRETKKVLEIVAIVGGQWPHSSYMVPGGIASVPSRADMLQCRLVLQRYRRWYERRVLGCELERLRELSSAAEIDLWLEERAAHRESDLGVFIRFSRDIGLDRIGRAHEGYICYGALDLPQAGGQLVPAGVARGTQVEPFDQSQVTEHVAHSWFRDYDGGRHPSRGETRPYASGQESNKYSWAKAPRYDDHPYETGPLAEMVIAQNPLFTDIVGTGGSSAFARQLARLLRPCHLIPTMERWLSETTGDAKFYTPPGEVTAGEGFGLTQATRGALGHWVRLEGGTIEHYQIITPTAWNASPRDSSGTRGPLEQALIGTPIREVGNPVELGHVVRSFDPCLVCTVHLVERRRGDHRLTIDTSPCGR